MPRYIPGAACWWPMIPKPPVIGAAASDAQAAVGIYWYYTGRAGHPGGAAPGGRTAAVRRYHRWPLAGGE